MCCLHIYSQINICHCHCYWVLVKNIPPSTNDEKNPNPMVSPISV